jgi:hypothetical protein
MVPAPVGDGATRSRYLAALAHAINTDWAVSHTSVGSSASTCWAKTS